MKPKRTPKQNQRILTCKRDYAYFLRRFAHIESAAQGQWIPFELWPAQAQVLNELRSRRQVIALKARQLGITWLVLGYILAEMIFSPITIALFFSRGETEAKDLLVRLKGMYSRLPTWMKDGAPTIDNSQEWRLPSGSRALSFPTTGGRSYTASIVVVDEADFIDSFNEVMNAVKPTIDAGGKMFLISTVDKTKPESPFKNTYRGAKREFSEWHPIFLPWHARPDRTPEWYERIKAEIATRTGSLDDVHQEYPATDAEALAPRSQDKRIPAIWLLACYDEMQPLRFVNGAPVLPGLEIYKAPVEGRRYVIGGDPAEGNPTSDDSSLTVVDYLTGEECAVLSGKYEPGIFASHIRTISRFYNNAATMIERNNHGHAVILWLNEHARRVKLLPGHDSDPEDKERKAGWMSSTLGKALLYTECADHFYRNASPENPKMARIVLHSEPTYMQLASIEGATLRAPKDQHDDRADSYALAIVGCVQLATVRRGVPLAQGTVKGW